MSNCESILGHAKANYTYPFRVDDLVRGAGVPCPATESRMGYRPHAKRHRDAALGRSLRCQDDRAVGICG